MAISLHGLDGGYGVSALACGAGIVIRWLDRDSVSPSQSVLISNQLRNLHSVHASSLIHDRLKYFSLAMGKSTFVAWNSRETIFHFVANPLNIGGTPVTILPRVAWPCVEQVSIFEWLSTLPEGKRDIGEPRALP
jgi:hypothetical protein